MNLRHYLLSSVCRSPDEPAAAEPETVQPVVAEVIADDPLAGQDPAPADPSVSEPAGDPPAPTEHGNKGKTPWYMARISEETGRRNAEAEARRAAEQRAENAEALLQRMQNAGDEPGKAPAPPRAETPRDFDQAVRERAEQIVFEDTKVGLIQKGRSDFGQAAFDDACSVVVACGLQPDALVRDLLTVDGSNASKLIMELARDGERAARLAGMNPGQRISELTRMAMTTASTEPAPKPAPAAEAPRAPAISRAPTPKPAVAPHAAAPEVDPTTPEGDGKMDDKQWEAWYRNKYMKRTG